MCDMQGRAREIDVARARSVAYVRLRGIAYKSRRLKPGGETFLNYQVAVPGNGCLHVGTLFTFLVAVFKSGDPWDGTGCLGVLC